MMTGLASDARPVVAVLTRPITSWLRVPLWGAALALLIFLGWLAMASRSAGREESAAVARLTQVLRMGKAYHATISRLDRIKQSHVAAAAAAAHGVGVALVSADSAQRLALRAAEAVQAAKTAEDSIQALGREVGALLGAGASLRDALAQQQQALADLQGAYQTSERQFSLAKDRVAALEAAGHAVVQASACKLISLHPCIRGVHGGVHVGYGGTLSDATVHVGPQVGVSVQLQL